MAKQAAGGPALALSVTDSTRTVIQKPGSEEVAEQAAGGPALALSVTDSVQTVIQSRQ